MGTDARNHEPPAQTSAAQQTLPFGAAEGSHAERKRMLGLALIVVKCDKQLAALCEWIFNVTGGGVAGELSRSYEQLADRPWGLCCSVSKARATVHLAHRLGLVEITTRYAAAGMQSANGYAIDWSGVSALIASGRPSRVGVSTEHPGVSTEHGGVATRHLQPLLIQKLNTPPPPPPVTARAPAADFAPLPDEWNLAVAAVSACGVGDACGCVLRARGRGVSAADVRAMAEHWREVHANRGWREAALHYRIRNAVPGQPIFHGWPPAKRGKNADADRQSAREAAATRIVRQGRTAGRSEAAIRDELFGAGLAWPGEAAPRPGRLETSSKP